jgi:hypothetical protein
VLRDRERMMAEGEALQSSLDDGTHAIEPMDGRAGKLRVGR